MKRVVHEIRNHLAVAVANVEAFRDGVLEPNAARLTAVLAALHQANALLRDLPRGDSPAALPVVTQTVDICDVITNEVVGLEALAKERGVSFEVRQCTKHGAGCTDFPCDPTRIGEIVNNVVSNAIRYAPRGGHVDVGCHPGVGQIEIDVTDDGAGIDREDVAHIFEDGFRGHAARETSGSGIGLALTKRFVEEHGGSIDVSDAEGHGTRFDIRLRNANTHG